MLPHRARDDYFFFVSWIGGILSFLGSGGFLLFLITPPYNCGFILKEFPRNFGFFYIIPVPFPKTWSQAFFFFGRKPFFFAINYNCRKVCYVVISWPQIQLLFEKLAKRIKFFRITSMQKPITTNSLYSPLQKLILYFVRKRVMIIHRKLLQFCIFLPKVL